MGSDRKYRIQAKAATLFVLFQCSFSVAHAAGAGDDELYSSLHAYYAEFCAVSQILKKPGFGAEIRGGGPGGHSVLYLNGVCRDKSAHYPTVQVCDATSSVGRQGVGLSVNAHFKNANWIATEGKNFFFHGNLEPNERLTRHAYDRTQAQARDMAILDGVEFHSEVFDDMPAGMSRNDYMYEVSIATDYAIGFGRDRYCARVPMDRGKMTEMVAFLNHLNAAYKDGKQDFEWDVLRNNCAHMTHNALAAVGLWKEWETDQFFLFAAFDFPVPKNEFVNLMRRTNDLPLDELDKLYADDAARRDLMEGDWLPTEQGALAEWESVVQDNDVYEANPKLIFYDEPIFAVYQKRFNRIVSDPRYFDVRANLRYFSTLYERIETARKPIDWYLSTRNKEPPFNKIPSTRIAPSMRRGFPAFYAQFYGYIDRKRAEVDAELAALRAFPSAQR